MAFLLNAACTPIILFLSHRFNWYDEIDHRKIHSEDTPRLGGPGIVLSFAGASVAGLVFLFPGNGAGLWGEHTLLFVLIGLAIIHLLGLYDDFVNLRAPFKFMIQIIAAAMPVAGGIYARMVDLPFLSMVAIPPVAAVPLTIFWIVALTNAVNLIDGADGLAGGITLIAVLFMGLISFSQGFLIPAVLAFALAGSLAGFLLFNFPPARIFMGDGGSLSMGYILAVLPLMGISGTGNSGQPAVAVLPVITLLFIPVADTLMAIVRRARRGKPIHSPDREHLHHRLIDRGFHGPRLLAVAYGVMVVLGMAAFSWFVMPHEIATAVILLVWAIFLVGAIRSHRTI